MALGMMHGAGAKRRPRTVLLVALLGLAGLPPRFAPAEEWARPVLDLQPGAGQGAVIQLQLRGASPTNAYTLMVTTNLGAPNWQDVTVSPGATNAMTLTAGVLTNSPQAFFRVRDSSTEDSDGDGVSNRLEILRGANPNQADTDGDGIDDFDEIYTLHSDPGNDADSREKLAMARQAILLHWRLLYAVPLTFTNEPGSARDLSDLGQALMQLSGKFYTPTP